MSDVIWCSTDDCPASLCGGPHVAHHCPNGDLVVLRADSLEPCPFCGWSNDREIVEALASILRRVERPRRYAGDWEADTARRQIAALEAAGFEVVRKGQTNEPA